ncbi:hypothetical protein FH972_025070 [Carpinus fangiana]|uniref:Uncharacterized protein n=1 Tax=Carpinus fangiana TaxID=176857 RepID=A0A5N6L041_9ROSI|nr:hypothetical protein FH972_025070 [Carpinus fangiana]
MRRSLVSAAAAWLTVVAAQQEAVKPIPPTTSSVTSSARPEQTSLILDVLSHPEDVSVLGPGFIFISAYFSIFPPDWKSGKLRPEPKKKDWGPHIFDQRGNLVWHAPDGWVESRAWPFQACDFAGKVGTHLCMNDGDIDLRGGFSSGATRIFNSSYIEVARLEGTAGIPGPDGHELNVLPGGMSALQDAYSPVPVDLTGFGGHHEAFLYSGCFQERSLLTSEAIFTWCSADHIPIDESHAWLPTLLRPDVGTVHRPWDYIHVNALDKDIYGDYYVSAKGSDTVYKIAGTSNALAYPGEILWKLGGWNDEWKVNDFKLLDGLNFSGQHHVRVLSVSNKTTLLSLYDNAWLRPGRMQKPYESSTTSNGKFIELDTDAMTARLVGLYLPPDNFWHVTSIQGTTQQLQNGNVFMGWGPNNILTEHTSGVPGTILWHGIFGSGLDLEGYRSYKQPWVGHPLEPPDIFAYAQDCEAPVYTYMSWNGATEHRTWTIFAADYLERGEGRSVLTVDKAGYETVAQVPKGQVRKYVYAQAFDEFGHILGTSKRIKVWIPDQTIRSSYSCGLESCGPHLKSYDIHSSQADLCHLM